MRQFSESEELVGSGVMGQVLCRGEDRGDARMQERIIAGGIRRSPVSDAERKGEVFTSSQNLMLQLSVLSLAGHR